MAAARHAPSFTASARWDPSSRLLVERGAEIVGAIARSSHKVGRDLGEVAGLDRPLGIAVEADADAVLRRPADIAIVCVGSSLDRMCPIFAACLKHRLNSKSA